MGRISCVVCDANRLDGSFQLIFSGGYLSLILNEGSKAAMSHITKGTSLLTEASRRTDTPRNIHRGHCAVTKQRRFCFQIKSFPTHPLSKCIELDRGALERASVWAVTKGHEDFVKYCNNLANDFSSLAFNRL